VRLVIARCSVDYIGRLTAHLAMAPRLLLVKNDDHTKMEEGEYFAIETFGSTGRGRVVENVSAVGINRNFI